MRNSQDSFESKVFAMILLLNYWMQKTSQKLSNLISSVINNLSTKQPIENTTTDITKNYRTTITKIIKKDEPVEKQLAKEFVTTIEAVIDVQRTHEGKEEQSYIYLQDSVKTMEAAGLEQKYLTST